MDKRLTEQELCTTAWDALQKSWRQQHFKNLTTDRLVEGMRRIDASTD